MVTERGQRLQKCPKRLSEWGGQGKVGGVRVQRPGGQELGSERSRGLELEVEEHKERP